MKKELKITKHREEKNKKEPKITKRREGENKRA